jgi:adenine-specific DNA-methyltransferase
MNITTLDGKTRDIAEENIQKLRQIFPDVFTEKKVDFEKLQQVLGDYVEDGKERYNFTWNGKGQALRLSQTPSLGTLRPCKEESKDWDTTQNLYIEGDNLEVLKLLQKSYHSKVKMIYIDPPYNTGKDFVYPDDFHDSLENYKKITGQVDNEGNRISTNAETSGRYHTDWLNMMYPRLRLARNLITEDGVIFISIDDNEVDNLKKICNEVFGEDNFIAQIIHKNNSMKNQSKFIGVSTEYVIIYTKSIECLKSLQKEWRYKKKGAADINEMYKKLKNQQLSFDEIREEILEMYSRPKYAHLSRWNKVDENGVFTDKDLSRDNGYKDFTIINPTTGKECIIPNRGWGKQYSELIKLQQENMIWYGDNGTPPREKSYITNNTESVLDNFIFADTSIDKKMIDNMFGAKVFEFPKSLEMLKTLFQLCSAKDDIILDFFSGSATTAHAVMQLNIEDGGNRKFIMVQLPELTDEKSDAYKAGYMNICEIGKERIRRAGEKIKEENKDKENIENLDIGFKVLKLDTSNIRKWQPDYDNLELSLLDYTENYVEGRSELDVVYEIMLKYGLNLSYTVDEFTFANKKVYSIGFGMLMICLDNEIIIEVANGILEKLKELAPESTRIVFKDNGFKADSNKTNIKEILKCGGIEEFITL